MISLLFQNTLLTYKKKKRGTIMPLFFLLLLAGSASAQQTDTTNQQPPQLETRPPARPTPAPAPTPPPAPVVESPAEKTAEAAAPEENPRFDILKKLFIGGSASLGFQSNRYYGNYFNIGGSPLVGYKITKYLAIGPGLIYQFYSMAGTKVHDYGLKGFGQVILYKSILAHFEHAVVQTQDFEFNPQGQITREFRQQVSSTLLGGGYRTMANDRFGMDLYFLLPVSYSTNTYNTSYAPVIRAGFIYHLK